MQLTLDYPNTFNLPTFTGFDQTYKNVFSEPKTFFNNQTLKLNELFPFKKPKIKPFYDLKRLKEMFREMIETKNIISKYWNEILTHIKLKSDLDVLKFILYQTAWHRRGYAPIKIIQIRDGVRSANGRKIFTKGTELDRKTIKTSLERLQDQGFIKVLKKNKKERIVFLNTTKTDEILNLVAEKKLNFDDLLTAYDNYLIQKNRKISYFSINFEWVKVTHTMGKHYPYNGETLLIYLSPQFLISHSYSVLIFHIVIYIISYIIKKKKKEKAH